MTVKSYLAENQGSVKDAGWALLRAGCLAMLEARNLAIVTNGPHQGPFVTIDV